MKWIMLLLTLLLMGFSGNSIAQEVISINAGSTGYNHLSNVQGTGVKSDFAVRTSGLTQVVAQYRILNNKSLPVGTIVKVTWPDGSSERGTVIAVIGSVLAEPIPGTQSKPPNGGVGYTIDSNGNSLGGSNVNGFRPIYGTQTVCVGGYCESITVVVGYEYTFDLGGNPKDRLV